MKRQGAEDGGHMDWVVDTLYRSYIHNVRTGITREGNTWAALGQEL